MADEPAYTDLEPTVLKSLARSRNFRSVRWKLLLPLLAVIVPIAMAVTYAVTDSAARHAHATQLDALIADARAISQRVVALGDSQRREAGRVAFTQHVPELIAAGDSSALRTLIEPLAVAGDLDYLILVRANGDEAIGLQRKPDASGLTGFEVSQGTLLDRLAVARPVLSGQQPTAAGLVRTNAGYALLTAAPVLQDNAIVGVAVVGLSLDHAIRSIRPDDLTQVVLYGPQGEVLAAGTAFPPGSATLNALALPPTLGAQMLQPDNNVPIRDVQVDQTRYEAAYIPFVVDSSALGLIGLLRMNDAWYAADASRQLVSLGFSLLAAGVLGAAFAVAGILLNRLARVTRTTQALASGDPYARTDMKATDEIGELGQAIDVYARRVHRRQDTLEKLLMAQRRESARLTAVLESIPDGIVVQDLDGRVVLMNDGALKLLGSQRVFRSSPLNELTAIVTDTLGPALAPGVYSLGDPQRVPLDGKILHAQAAAILTLTEQRIGTVIVLRDITDEVRREQAREALLAQMTREARVPVDDQTLKERPEDALHLFIREVNKNAIALQRMIAEIRDLSTVDARTLQESQRALPAETLLWDIVREWQPMATVAHVEFHVLILRREMLVLGEERRLRWAIGNLVDNAIKYTPAEGHITFMLRATDDERCAQWSIQDTGVGIAPDDLPHVFTRFYRGKPITRTGQVLQTPGTGQGLFIARRVIEAHGGTIKLSSAIGQGTQVVFSLPLTASVTLSLEREPEREPERQPVAQETADVLRSEAPGSQQADESDRAEQADDEPPGQ